MQRKSNEGIIYQNTIILALSTGKIVKEVRIAVYDITPLNVPSPANARKYRHKPLLETRVFGLRSCRWQPDNMGLPSIFIPPSDTMNFRIPGGVKVNSCTSTDKKSTALTNQPVLQCNRQKRPLCRTQYFAPPNAAPCTVSPGAHVLFASLPTANALSVSINQSIYLSIYQSLIWS